MKRRDAVFLAFLVFLLVAVNYNFLDKGLTDFLKDYKDTSVSRVIDGDTIVTSEGEHLRLLGINTPETSSKEKYSLEAKQYLSNLTLNKSVRLEIKGRDLYNRTLAYVFLGGENVNEKIIENGLANFYFPEGKDEYYGKFKETWGSCISKDINLCKKSSGACSRCIILENLDVKSQVAVFRNSCSFQCNLTDWQIKDEGRKEFNFPPFILGEGREVDVKVGNKSGNQSVLFWPGYSYVWTSSGDTLFLRDENHDLVLWKNY